MSKAFRQNLAMAIAFDYGMARAMRRDAYANWRAADVRDSQEIWDVSSARCEDAAGLLSALGFRAEWSAAADALYPDTVETAPKAGEHGDKCAHAERG